MSTGDLDRAEALIRVIADAEQRARALARLAEAAARTGDLDRARALAGQVELIARRTPSKAHG